MSGLSPAPSLYWNLLHSNIYRFSKFAGKNYGHSNMTQDKGEVERPHSVVSNTKIAPDKKIGDDFNTCRGALTENDWVKWPGEVPIMFIMKFQRLRPALNPNATQFVPCITELEEDI